MCKLFVYLSTEMLNHRFIHRLHVATLLTTLSSRGPYLSRHIFLCTSVKLRSKESGSPGLQMAQYLAFHVQNRGICRHPPLRMVQMTEIVEPSAAPMSLHYTACLVASPSFVLIDLRQGSPQSVPGQCLVSPCRSSKVQCPPLAPSCLQ